MQASLMCKCASMFYRSLNVNLIVVENLTLKSLHHYHVKFCKNSPDVYRVEFTSKDPLSLLSRLHLRLFCITFVPVTVN
jgi:hypothetical protein